MELPVATSRRSRLLGLALLGRDRAGPGLLIPRCRAVHTFGVRFELDLLFLDGAGRVIDLRRSVPPGRFARSRGADAVLELPSPLRFASGGGHHAASSASRPGAAIDNV